MASDNVDSVVGKLIKCAEVSRVISVCCSHMSSGLEGL